MLSEEPGYTVVGQSSDDADLPSEMEVFKPDLVLWDLGQDPTAAIERLEDLDLDGTPVLALLPDKSYASKAWSSGARGLLMRHVDSSRLRAGLTALIRGLAALDPEIELFMGRSDTRTPLQSPERLTPREVEVLQCLAEGLPNKEIAHRLAISEHTVKFHVTAIMDKLGAQSRTEAVVLATRLGMILL